MKLTLALLLLCSSLLWGCKDKPAAAPPSADRGGATDAGGDPEAQLADELARAIRVGADGIYDIESAVVDKLMSNPELLARGGQLVPATQDGKAAGFKLHASPPGSVYALLGLMKDDLVTSINGLALDSEEHAREAYDKLRGAKTYELEILREGTQVTLRHRVR